MEEDSSKEFIKLPVEDRCVHKLWKARLHGYEEAIKLFNQIVDEKSPEWSKFLGLIKKFVTDSNAVAQEKGLEATSAFVENCGSAGKTVGEVMSGIVAKCISAPKTRTRELALQVTLLYIEVEKQEAVQEELVKGMDHKNPKTVAACIAAVTQALRAFGPKVINIKPLVKKMPSLLEDRDKTVRDETKAMVVEMYRWIGVALKPQLSSLKPVQTTELETEFEKLKGEKAVPTRYLRSQQAKQAKLAAAAAEEGDDDVDGSEGEEEAPIDPYELMTAVDILSKLPANFFDNIEAKKWQDRKEAVDALETLLQNSPKLESGDYGDLVRALKKIISKDTNVMVVAVAGKCLAGLATGLKKRFQPYAGACIPSLLEKFREKKVNVVTALREATDAVFLSTTLEHIQEDVAAALDNKNPSVKAETAAFVARCFSKSTAAQINKKLLKAYTTALLKTLNEPDPSVRDNSAEALGTLLKVVGEKALMPFVGDVDNLKMAKIRECCEKAVITAKPVKVPSVRPSTAPARVKSDEPASQAGSTAPKPVKRPTSGVGGPKRPTTTASAASAKKPAAAGKKVKDSKKPTEKEMTDEEVEEKVADLFSPDTLSGLGDSVWKTRLSAVEEVSQVIRGLDTADAPTQILLRTLQKKPGLKDTNFQVLKARLEAVKLIAENYRVSTTAAGYVVNDVAEKLGDAKNGPLAGEVLTALAEATKLDYVAGEVMEFAFNVQKNPKVQQEALTWLSQAILEFGFVVQAKPLMENLRKALAATNPAVRTSAIQIVGTLSLYIGPQLNLFFENEKPALLQQINAEMEKHSGEEPPTPIRGQTKSTDAGCGDIAEEEEGTDFAQEDILPRVDIGPLLNDALIQELADKNWKVRNEALQKLTNIISEARFITGNLGELPPVLTQRLSDSNAKISATALTICQSLGTAMGPACKQHIRVFFPGFLQCMGDSKVWIRTAAVSCINTYGDLGSYKEFFEGEMIADSLKTGSPSLRVELYNWLTERLPQMKSVPKDELLACLPYLYANFEDRNADVRKNAQEAALGFMIHLGYEAMLKATSPFKPGSRTVIVQILDKVRANLPAKPAPPPKSKGVVSSSSDDQLSKGSKIGKPTAAAAGAKQAANAKVAVKPKTGSATKAPGRKKDEEADTSPLLQVNNLKNQRSIDEQKLKILKWNFTTPREEFVELLRDQMNTAAVNKSLIANMFHSDFKFHLRAIEALVEDLPDNGKALTCNLDLILKWMSLRFFDTNPSVLLKGLEYLQTVFAMLIEEQYSMLETEASSFIPYLILKVGESKDAVRNSVHALFKQIGQVYSVSKLFSYIMDGLKSKNARQRTECLEELGYLIENYGISVCQPTPAAALKEVAKQISDRDNSVRNAALNCVVQAYFLEGERVYKLVGQISDKDMSLLEERIKRAAKNKPVARVAPATIRQTASPLQSAQQVQMQPQQQQQLQVSPGIEREASSSSLDEDQVAEVPAMHYEPEPVQPVRPRPVSGPFGLDMEFIEKIETGKPTPHAPQLIKIDTHYLEDENSPQPITVNANHNVFNTLNTRPTVNSLGSIHDSFKTLKLNTVPARDPVEEKLDSIFNQIASSDVNRCRDALLNVDYIIQSDGASLLIPSADHLVTSCLAQLRTLALGNTVYSKSEQAVVYRTIFATLHSFYNQPLLSRAVSVDGLHDSLYILILMLAERRLENLLDNDKFVQTVNILVMNIIEKAEHTKVTCALMKLLHESVGSGDNSPAKMQELIMKSIWKLVRLFPSWEPDVEYESILYEVHIFLKDYPSRMWREAQSDIPLRTVKTLLHTMVKQRGSGVLNHMSRISEPSDSELPLYLGKLIKSLKQDDVKLKKEVKAVPQQRLPKDLHEELTEIFKKIGSKDQTKEGLRLLYEFKRQHAEASVEPFLRKSSQFFQDYIERGLQTIELDRRRQAGAQATATLLSSQLSVSSTTSVADKGNFGELTAEKSEDGVDVHYFVERLKALHQKAGFETPGSSTNAPPPKKFDGDLNFNAELAPAPTQRTEVLTEVSNRDTLRRKLEEVKGLAR